MGYIYIVEAPTVNAISEIWFHQADGSVIAVPSSYLAKNEESVAFGTEDLVDPDILSSLEFKFNPLKILLVDEENYRQYVLDPENNKLIPLQGDGTPFERGVDGETENVQ